MREIKFKAIGITGEWVFGSFIHSKHFAGCPNEYRIHDLITGIESAIRLETVGQFTGFHDSKGNEIYEGDIISDKFETDEGLIVSRETVVWDSLTGSWMLDQRDKQDGSYLSSLYENLNDYEYTVMGNVTANVARP